MNKIIKSIKKWWHDTLQAFREIYAAEVNANKPSSRSERRATKIINTNRRKSPKGGMAWM